MGRRYNAGFTLIELMIVVAIIGILASLAIPNFLLFQCKAKQAEAKGNLAAIFANETGFFADANTYGTDLVSLGWQPAGAPLYLYGWNVAGFPALPPGNYPAYNGAQENTYIIQVIGNPPNYTTKKMVDLQGNALTAAQLPANNCGASSFVAGAVGDINPDAAIVTDTWTMDSEKNLNSIINDCEQ